MAAELSEDARGLSEVTGVVILVGMTVVVTGTVGIHVLVVQNADTGPPNANFTYDYVEGASTLIIAHEEGDELPAGSVTINDTDRGVAWATLAGINESATVTRGDAVPLSTSNEWGEPVRPSDQIEIYLVREGNATKLDEWEGP
ncbi:type IV pilin N-terminal domain-containing protein [Halomicrobium salinisoli]|uniref:type IV pilin N-terminal domain-containing protein n=1 Tax=Halomicrobium salinisoli TaxID=2878391 RepID=UPI001CF00BBE|nr:type IV pilin N-terminal domain-containing protein [Halomicrobium salinisoli]